MKSFVCTLMISLYLIHGAFCNIELNVDSIKVQEMQVVAEKVLSELKAAKGILDREPPRIEVKQFSGGVKIASMNYDQGLINLDIRTYNICNTIEEGHLNALSFIIGHELGHYIHKHGAINHIDEPSETKAFALAGTEAKSTHPGFPNRYQLAIREYAATHNEAEADLEGAFLGYLAGYQPMEAGISLLNKVYSDTLGGLTSNTPGYPSLEDRIAIVKNTAEEMAKITPLFEMAKYLTAVGQYADAVAYLEEVAVKFKSREVYNNIGVLHIFHILQNMREPLTEYEFPLILDAEFRAPHPQHVVGEEGTILRYEEPSLLSHDLCYQNELQLALASAEEYFNKAINFDADYAPAFLNKSITQTLRGLLYKGVICRSNQKIEYMMAMTSAYNASRIAGKDLSGYSLEHYDFVPTERQQPWSYDWDESIPFEVAFATLDSTMTDTGMVFIPITQIVDPFPFFKEVFNVKNLSATRSRIDNQSLFTKWSKNRMPLALGEVPPVAALFSNINVQIDLVKILSGEITPDSLLEVPSRGSFDTVKVVPFSRALELNMHNVIAKRNQDKFLNKRNATAISRSGPAPKSDHIIKFNSEEISNIQERIGQWKVRREIDSSRLTSYFKSGIIHIPQEVDKVFYQTSPAVQRIKYAETDLFRIYDNRSFISIDGRYEQSTFLAPKFIDSLDIGGDKTIIPGMSLDTVQSMLGRGFKQINFVTGSMAAFRTSHNQNLYQYVRKDGSNAPGQRVSIRFKNLVQLNKSDITVSTGVDISEDFEYGVIFELDNAHMIKSWILYYKKIQSGNELLTAERVNNTIILSTRIRS